VADRKTAVRSGVAARCGAEAVLGSRQVGQCGPARDDRNALGRPCLSRRHLLPQRNWNGHKLHIGGVGGVATRSDCRRRGYASIALDAAIQTMRDRQDVRFALLFCEPHNFAFYQSRGWHPFAGEVYAEQPEGKIRFEAMAPFVHDIKRAPRQGVIDLCGLPW